MVYLRLFYEFLKTGLFTVGGGLACLPFLREISTKTNWYTQEELINMIAISESTPGPIGANVATYAGYKVAGILGAIVATISLVIAPMIIIIIIANFLEKFKDNKYVQAVFYGIRPAVAGLIASAGYSVMQISIFAPEAFQQTKNILDFFNLKACLFFSIMLFAVMKFKKHPALYIGIAALIGIFIKF